MSAIRCWLSACVLGLGLAITGYASPEKASAPDGCPTITHVPLVTVVRGDPAVVAAKIECATGSVLDVTIYVRLLDAGKPTPVKMTGKGDGTYEAVVPVSMIRGISRFWYYIDARGKTTPEQAEEGVAQTRWYPVTILDAANLESGAGGSHKAAYWLLGAAGAVGGAVLWENHNDNGHGGTPPPPAVVPPPSQTQDDEDDDQEESSDEQEDDTPEVPACIPTGSGSLTTASACDTNTPIGIYACVSCPDAVLEASGSWGGSASQTVYNNEGCSQLGAPALQLSQPPGAGLSTLPGDYTITIRANGQVIATLPWPDGSYRNCL